MGFRATLNFRKFRPADKGSGAVIMDHSWYVNESDRRLNDTKYYQKQSSDLTNKVQFKNALRNTLPA